MNNSNPIIYVVDDDVSVCRALSLLLKPQGFRVETFTHAAGFLSFKYPRLPSCLVLDVHLPDISGLALQEIMAVRAITIPIVFITGQGDIPMSVKVMKAGAVDFLPKPFTEKELLNSINLALEKNKIQNKEQTEKSIINYRIKTLSPRELEVFHLVVKGRLSKQIAYKWGTSHQNIKMHRSRVMKKMRAQTVAELISFAQKAGLPTSYH